MRLFPLGDPAKGVGELGLPPLEPQALSDPQVHSLKSLCDRLPRLAAKKGRRWHDRDTAPHAPPLARPGQRLCPVLDRLALRGADHPRPRPGATAHRCGTAVRSRAANTGVRGKDKPQRTVFLSADARAALADYLEHERPADAMNGATALFLSAQGLPARSPDGRLSPRAINLIPEQLGRRHDAEVTDAARRISPLRPHDLCHTFAFQPAWTTGADADELERRLGHRSQRYIQRYTNPPKRSRPRTWSGSENSAAWRRFSTGWTAFGISRFDPDGRVVPR